MLNSTHPNIISTVLTKKSNKVWTISYLNKNALSLQLLFTLVVNGLLILSEVTLMKSSLECLCGCVSV